MDWYRFSLNGFVMSQARHRLLILILALITCYSQPVSAAPNYTIDHITTRDGLPQSSVKAIAQDEEGFLWIGTELGLARYDGYRFKRFAPPFEEGAATEVFADSRGRIWTSWYNGPATIVEPATGSWQILDVQRSGHMRHSFVEDDSGTVWLADTTHVYYFDEASSTPIAVADLKFIADAVLVQDFVLSGETIWVNTVGELVAIDTGTRRVVARIQHPIGDIYESNGSRSLWTHGGQVWFCNQVGVFRVDDELDLQLIHANGGDHVLSCMHDSEGSLWIGTQGSGALRINTSGTFDRFLHDPGETRSIAGDSVNYLQLDSGGRLWIMTYGTANLFEDGEFHRFEYGHDINDSYGGGLAAYEFFEDSTGVIWFGSEGSGLARISRFRSKFRHMVPPGTSSAHVRKPGVDKEGNLWIGMQTDGIYRLDTQSGAWSHFDAAPDDRQQLPTQQVRTLLATASGEVWAGSSLDIISRFEPASNTWTRHSLGGWNGIFDLLELPDGTIVVARQGEVDLLDPANGQLQRYSLEGRSTTRAVALSSKGSVYLGQHEMTSVLEFQPGKGIVASWSVGRDNASVFSLFEDRFGYVWVGTWGEGLFRLDPATGKTHLLNSAAGLPDNTIFGILPDDHDNLWISTYAGLARIGNCITEALTCTPEITVFDASDGLAITEFDSESHFRTARGELIFGGGDGLVIFHPDDIGDNSIAPKIRLVDVQLNNQPLQLAPSGKNTVLNSNFGALSFQFSALDFHNPANNEYRYRLDPDSAWVSLGTTPSLTLNNLGTGRYTLQISGSNNDGVWTEQPVTIRARVLPPVYLSNAAIVAYVILLIAAISVFVRSRERKLLTNKAALESMVASRTRELNDANMARDEFYANVSHEVRTPLTLLLNSVDRLENGETGDREETATKAIRRHSESLHRYIDSLITVSHLSSSPDIEWFAEDLSLFLRGLVLDIKDLAGRTEILFPDVECDVILVRSYPNALSTIFSNLLINAVKHTPEYGKIEIEVERSKQWVTVTIADSGPGINDDELFSIFDRGSRGSAPIRNIVGFGIGLNLVRQTVQALGGQVSVRNNPDRGACFEVRLVVADSSLPISSYESSAHLGLLNELPEQPESTRASSRSRESLPLILIVEDHDELRAEICEQLQDDYEIIQAGDAATAIELAEQHLPEIVVCDVMLPDKDGFEVVRQIKNNVVTDHIAVMLLTALADEESRLSGLAMRADAYLTKPYRQDELKLTIRNLLVGQRTMMRYSAMKAWQEQTARDDTNVGATRPFENRFMEALQSVYADNDNGVDEIAGLMAMSRRQLERKTRSCFEQSPNALLSEYRLSKAAALLGNGCPVSEATYRCGFGNQSHFATIFRKRFGVTPAAYKKNPPDPNR